MKAPLFLISALLMAGCAALPGASGPVTAVADLHITDAQRRVLGVPPADLQPWRKADIHHVKLSLYKAGDVAPIRTATVSQADLNSQVRFTNLVRSTPYKVEARAWISSTESATSAIDNFDAVATSCTTPFSTGLSETVNVGSLLLTLRNKTFSGTTNNATINVVDGTVVDTTASAGIILK